VLVYFNVQALQIDPKQTCRIEQDMPDFPFLKAGHGRLTGWLNRNAVSGD
jgi:hypothetical protein